MRHQRIKRRIGGVMLALALLLQTPSALAAPSKPGGGSATSVSYSGATVISASTTESGKTYAGTTAEQNALLVSGGTSTLTEPTVTKTGSPSGSSDDYDFYGTNAAVLVTSGATLNIEGGSVTTDANYASGVFAYGTGVVNISDATIATSARNSGGVMVTGGGTLTANDLTVTTSGNSSAAIRSDRGGGMLTINGGTYTASGTGSPAIYSTADITVNGATLISTASEGVVVEGKNSVALNKVTLTDTNTTHNGKSTTDKNIFLYQSMSGDASVGTASFTAKDCAITTNRGDTFYVTNTACEITLENNTFVNNNGDLLRAEAAAWGSSGKNGGQVTLTLDAQTVTGDIVLDSISTLDMTLKNGSAYTGAINAANTAQSVALALDAGSTLTLTGDTYVTGLTNADAANGNIYLNGHSLYVNGKAISANSAAPVTGGTAYARSQTVELDGKRVTLPAYALKSAGGGETNYVKLRDLASLLNGTAAQFNVDWDEAAGAVNIASKTAYAANGSEMTTPFSGDRSYKTSAAAILIDGAQAALSGIVLTDSSGGGYTYFKLRDVGEALGFNVGWSAARGIYIESGRPYEG